MEDEFLGRSLSGMESVGGEPSYGWINQQYEGISAQERRIGSLLIMSIETRKNGAIFAKTTTSPVKPSSSAENDNFGNGVCTSLRHCQGFGLCQDEMEFVDEWTLTEGFPVAMRDALGKKRAKTQRALTQWPLKRIVEQVCRVQGIGLHCTVWDGISSMSFLPQEHHIDQC